MFLNLFLFATFVVSMVTSSQAPTREPDRLDHLMAKVELMYNMLERHVKNTTDQFTYVEGQITALSSKIDDKRI